MQSPFLLGRLSDTRINLAIGLGNREMIDSGEREGEREGEVLSHALSRQSHSPSDIESCGYIITGKITPVRKKARI